MTTLNRNYVAAPLHYLVSNAQNNVLMGLRLIETVQEFPSPHSEELQRFAQVSFGVETSLEKRKWEFTRWVLQNGFAEINNAVKTALQRLFVFKTIELRLLNGEAFDVKQFEEELRRKVNE